MTTFVVAAFGILIALCTLTAILWSVASPRRRIWPPQHYSDWITPIVVWVPTFTLAGSLVWLGIDGWNELALPSWLRWGVGMPIIVIANLAVWSEVARFGMRQTGGAAGPLRTDGLYRWSRNPQYVADIAMVAGWLLLSASFYALPVGFLAIAVLLAAPFAEERWMEDRHGDPWRAYVATVRRFV